MKTFTTLITIAFTLAIHISCTSQTKKSTEETQAIKTDDISVYYFHYTRRCATCNAVEDISKSTIQDLYGEKVTFSSYNLDEDSGKDKGKELEIGGQTLMIMAGNSKIDITNEAFLFAKSQPDELKKIIKENIDGIISQ
jgi:hypothetical protein